MGEFYRFSSVLCTSWGFLYDIILPALHCMEWYHTSERSHVRILSQMLYVVSTDLYAYVGSCGLSNSWLHSSAVIWHYDVYKLSVLLGLLDTWLHFLSTSTHPSNHSQPASFQFVCICTDSRNAEMCMHISSFRRIYDIITGMLQVMDVWQWIKCICLHIHLSYSVHAPMYTCLQRIMFGHSIFSIAMVTPTLAHGTTTHQQVYTCTVGSL